MECGGSSPSPRRTAALDAAGNVAQPPSAVYLDRGAMRSPPRAAVPQKSGVVAAALQIGPFLNCTARIGNKRAAPERKSGKPVRLAAVIRSTRGLGNAFDLDDGADGFEGLADLLGFVFGNVFLDGLRCAVD